MAAVATLGGHTLEDDEVTLVSVSKRPHYSPRNRRLSRTITMHVVGEILGTTSDAIITKIAAIENALREDNRDFRLTINGTLAHQLINSGDCISGIRVIAADFPRGEPDELATVRTFSFALEATYDAVNDDLVSWHESIEKVGTGGPRFFIVETADYSPFAAITTLRSVVSFHQTGEAVGYANYPAPPTPVISVPSGGTIVGELEPVRKITHISGQQMGNALRFFTTRWSYTMFNDPSSFGAVDFLPTSK